jgi:hypothetical protein
VGTRVRGVFGRWEMRGSAGVWTNYKSTCKLLEQVNSFLTKYNLFINENFIPYKPLYVCMIRFVIEPSITRGGEELHEDNRKMVPIISESTREERKAGALPLKKKS